MNDEISSLAFGNNKSSYEYAEKILQKLAQAIILLYSRWQIVAGGTNVSTGDARTKWFNGCSWAADAMEMLSGPRLGDSHSDVRL